MIGQLSVSTVEGNLETLMAGIREAWHRALNPDVTPPAEQPVFPGTPLGDAFAALRPEVSAKVAEALNEVLYECRGAMDYAEEDSPVHRLACRVVQAMTVSLIRKKASSGEPDGSDND